jgi:hypothetical protein
VPDVNNIADVNDDGDAAAADCGFDDYCRRRRQPKSSELS